MRAGSFRPTRWLTLLVILLLNSALPVAASRSHSFLQAAGGLNTWSFTGSMNTARDDHTATLLANGKVLVTGGYNNGYLASAEIYDPSTGRWLPTDSLKTARELHTATLLQSGKVLVTGGYNNSGEVASSEIYDPVTAMWTVSTALANGNLNTARSSQTATLLSNGKVLLTGGYHNGYLSSSELYDPTIGKWMLTGSLTDARDNHTATLLPNGKVLVSGGYNNIYLGSSELYDPAMGRWTLTGRLNNARESHRATLLQNGKVLVSGGHKESNYFAITELYDPATGAWTASPSASNGSLHTGRDLHRATLLANGKVLVTGGCTDFDCNAPLASTELYDPATGRWLQSTGIANGNLNSARKLQTATRLSNGQVLIAGGYNNGYLASSELYDPTTSIIHLPLLLKHTHN